MRSRCFVICSKERAYADRLAMLLSEKIDFQIHVCSSVEQVEMLLKGKEIEILLLEECYYEKFDAKEIVREVIVLSEEYMDESDTKWIYKYQSADDILSEILKICMEDHHSGIFKQQLYKDSCLIGVYSPIHRIGKTSFAIALGKELAKKERVLYLNLEEYSGWKERYGKNEPYTLADLLYYERQEKGNLNIRLGIMTGDMEGLEYVAPMTISEDLKKVTFEEWKDLLEVLLSQRVYQKIIIDFGECIQGLWNLLNLCQQIYMPVSHQQESYAKILQFERNIEVLGYKELLEKTTQLEITGDMESYVRTLLQKEEQGNDIGRTASRRDFAGN